MKGQVTIFIIIGFVLVAAIGITFLVMDQEASDEILGADLEPIKNYMAGCLQKTLKGAVESVSWQGGYHYVKVPYHQLDREFIPYYRDTDGEYVPTVSQIGKEMSSYIDERIVDCVAGGDFPLYEIETLASEASIGNDVLASIGFKVIGESTEGSFSVSDSAPSDILDFLAVAKNIVVHDGLCLGCIVDSEIDITYEYLSSKDVLFTLDGKFRFLVEYEEQTVVEDLKITDIPDQEVYEGYQFEYDIECNKDAVFYDNSELFDVVDGQINFTAQEVGIHYVTITAMKDGQKDKVSFAIDVKEFLTADFTIVSKDFFLLDIGERFVYDVNVSRDGLFAFNDDTDLFDIDHEGIIDFTPTEKGDHAINIVVGEIGGAAVQKEVVIEII